MGEAEERVRALHVPVRLDEGGYPIPDEEEAARVVCEGCSWFDQDDGQQMGESADWPCDVMQALDELAALVARLRLALQEIDSKDRHGFRDEDGVWHERQLSLAQKALALTPEAALAELEVHRE